MVLVKRKTRFQLLKNDRGISLVNVMIALALGAIVVLGLSQGLSQLYKTKRTVDTKTEEALLIARIQKGVSRLESCRLMLTGVTLNSTGVVIPNLTPEIFEGVEVKPGVFVNDFKLIESPVPATVVTRDGSQRRSAYIRFTLRDTTNGETTIRKFRDIPIRVTVDGTLKVQSCIADTPEDTICRNMASNFDPGAAPGECNPQDRCLYGGSFSSAPSVGFFNGFTGGQSCPAGFNRVRGGSINVTRGAGKSDIVNDRYEVVHCLRCDLTLATSTGGSYDTNHSSGAWLGTEDAAMDAWYNQWSTNNTDFTNGFWALP